MPVYFPEKDPATGELIDVPYWTPRELAGRLHISPRAIWRNCAAGRWPHIKVQGRYYLNADDVTRVVELLRYEPDEIPRWEPQRSLGIVLSDDDVEGVQ